MDNIEDNETNLNNTSDENDSAENVMQDVIDEEDCAYYDQHGIEFRPNNHSVKPIYNYLDDGRLNDDVVERLTQLNYRIPTPIQAVAIPIILKKRDIIGISKTGSGKTLAFVLPALMLMSERMLNNDNSLFGPVRPTVVVITPSRELAQQIKEVVDQFNIATVCCVFGGESRREQITYIRSRRPSFIISTPGRLNDMIQSNIIDMKKVKYLVLDEADIMLGTNFNTQVKSIIQQTPVKGRQTLLFSATWGDNVEKLAKPFLQQDQTTTINVGKMKLKANPYIKQHIFHCTEFEKQTLLRDILIEFSGFKVMVFTRSRTRCSELAAQYIFNNVAKIEYIHGGVEQVRRTRLIRDFNLGKFDCLFATDVASRGLDIPDVHVVVNYDLPDELDTYVHRIGRTGRNDQYGKVFTFATSGIFENIQTLEKLCKFVDQSGGMIPSVMKLQLTQGFYL